MKTVRGTRDIYGYKGKVYDKVVASFIDIANCYGLQPMYTPIFEMEQVFNSVGETSDIVTKEMYLLKDRNGEDLALRPEGTASVLRAIASNGLSQSMPLKCYYHGPMFRYERPQKGRYRQFHQTGVEILGSICSLAQIEAIKIAYDWLVEIDLKDKFVLHINSIGDEESRNSYRQALVSFLKNFKDKLSEDSKIRLERNPLRILDSKNKGDQKILRNAPIFSDFLTEEAKQIFTEVKDGLKQLDGLKFKEDSKLVRGLDYYQHTVFEFISDEGLAFLAGGCYGGIAKRFGLKEEIVGCGWASGIDRLMELVPNIELKKSFGFIILEEELKSQGLALACELRKQGFVINMSYELVMKKAIKKMNSIKVAKTLILGKDEFENKQIAIKDMENGEQINVDLDLAVISKFLEKA